MNKDYVHVVIERTGSFTAQKSEKDRRFCSDFSSGKRDTFLHGYGKLDFRVRYALLE